MIGYASPADETPGSVTFNSIALDKCPSIPDLSYKWKHTSFCFNLYEETARLLLSPLTDKTKRPFGPIIRTHYTCLFVENVEDKCKTRLAVCQPHRKKKMHCHHILYIVLLRSEVCPRSKASLHDNVPCCSQPPTGGHTRSLQ